MNKEYTNDIFMEKVCKKCSAKIRWIKTEKGKWMPVDSKEITIVTIAGETKKGYIPHWATCVFEWALVSKITGDNAKEFRNLTPINNEDKT